MSEWGELIVESLLMAADVGLTLLFYRMYRSRLDTVKQVQDMEPLPISELKQLIKEHPSSAIEYGMVKGQAYSIGHSLKSGYTDDKGPIRCVKRVVHKRERNRGYWSDHTSTLSYAQDKVPFALFDKKGTDSILVTEPGTAQCLEDSYITSFDQYEPNTRSLTESMFDRVVGDITKGYQTTEQILKNGTTLLGLGRIVMTHGGSLELRAPTTPNSLYILTSMTKDELIAHLKSKATVYKFITGVFGVTGLVLLWVTLRPRIQHWLANRRARQALNDVREQLQGMRELREDQASHAEEREEDGNSCVICWSSARELANRPCGHVCSCLRCYEAMPHPKQCPVCRSNINEIIPIFIS
ncbi:mitochondrial ubiquitin ligase activator of nfkb 1-like [Watersipora subatra]|uniref:mitochondrial ubiquitin ligase activator of nfkb 1-like n=1 Tax=Watersipora subatra TaxID=2589382 RepID=UPI00355C5BC2